jgi:hypothetical protein
MQTKITSGSSAQPRRATRPGRLVAPAAAALQPEGRRRNEEEQI